MEFIEYSDLPKYKIATVSSDACGSAPKVCWKVEGDNVDQPFLSAKTVSTYPLMPHGARDGDPIVDRFYVLGCGNRTLLSVADGCNWGVRPQMAARDAINAFSKYFTDKERIGLLMNDLQDAGHFLLRSFCEAHNQIIKDKSDIWEAGTTTLLGSLVIEFEVEEKLDAPKWGFLCASVGDCKAFHVSLSNRAIIDVTVSNHQTTQDRRDPGGRLGPYVGQGWPDLRNLRLYFTPCCEGDFIIIVSDGVHDNLDPQTMGKLPKDFGIDTPLWDSIPAQRVQAIKQVFMISLLEDLVFNTNSATTKVMEFLSQNGSLKSSQEFATAFTIHNKNKSPPIVKTPIPLPEEITSRIINHCVELTSKSRDFMQENPKSKQPSDFVSFPGKMDHTTCVTYKVSSSAHKLDCDNSNSYIV
eukprot:TRINITY_DN1085_c0_g1_i1.p1 TRINITY_DN1085_c0_g1~~TRINITY_DN1085_c0_g1_i1.p1  ORF type:complete len:412 (+),score=76.02 TRINITY_DN1085_c0_g1_i1:415-1650(+)